MLKIRRLSLNVRTSGPTCGTDLEFGPGLNILRADNSSGKSTCLQSIIYALGLEGMMSPSRDIPLPHAMTDRVEVDGQEFRVEKSSVSIEIENGQGEILTIGRPVKDDRFDKTLIRTRNGPTLSQPGVTYTQREYFVRRGGSAQREAGFHYELAKFLGWELPKVTRMDGSEGTLYLECLFPYFFVEQKHGWSGVQARIPTYLGIQDVSKRSAEFILALDAMDMVLESQRIESSISLIETDWKNVDRTISDVATRAGILVKGIPRKPSASWQRAELVSLELDTGSGLISLDNEISRLADELEEQGTQVLTSIGEAAPEIEESLSLNQDRTTELSLVLSSAIEDWEQAKKQEQSLELRIEALEEDLRKHKDAALLQRLGASNSYGLEEEVCPTCGQNLPDGFEITDYPLTIEDNISHLERELATFRSMRSDANRVGEISHVRVFRMRQEMEDLRATIRSQKDALISPSSLPDAARLAQRLRAEEKLNALRGIRDSIESSIDELDSLAVTWQQNKGRLAALRRREQTAPDESKIRSLRDSLTTQLESYGFRSLEPRAIDVSKKTYRPNHEGFDLGFDLSASDMIRVIWAYLFSLMEVSREFHANHPQLLIFDEPRQQEAARFSFQQLLNRAARNGVAGSQVIFATSEEEDDLNSMLRGLPHQMMSIPRGEKLIKPRVV
ncbi:AAA family ATPase [Streptomyces sp. NPDC055749]